MQLVNILIVFPSQVLFIRLVKITIKTATTFSVTLTTLETPSYVTCLYNYISQKTCTFSFFPSVESSIRVSGAEKSYFPKGQDCLKTKADAHLRNATLVALENELKDPDEPVEPTHRCLVCG